MITEFRQKAPQHTSPFTIEVEYLSESNIEDTLKELLWSYSQFYIPGRQEEMRKSDSVNHSEEYNRCLQESEVAWSTLEAAFENKQGFKKELFRDTTEDAQRKALSLLKRWARELDWPKGGTNGLWTCTAQTAEECREITSRLMSNRIWPFMKVIRCVKLD